MGTQWAYLLEIDKSVIHNQVHSLEPFESNLMTHQMDSIFSDPQRSIGLNLNLIIQISFDHQAKELKLEIICLLISKLKIPDFVTARFCCH